MDMRDYLQEIWDKVFIEYKNNKIQLIREYRDNIDYMKVFEDKLKEFHLYNDKQIDGIIQYLDVCNEIKEKQLKCLKKMDNNIVLLINENKTDVFIIDWLVLEFVKAVIDNTKVHFSRLMKNNYTLYKDREIKNNRVMYILQEGIKDCNITKLEDNLQEIDKGDRVEYQVKKQPIFWDYKSSIILDDPYLYHGTDIESAKNILGTDKLLSKDMFDLGTRRNNYFNIGKIFFTDKLKESIKYATRWSIYQKHIIFQLDLSKFKLYKREHLLVNRQGNLFFVNSKEIPLIENLLKIYLLEGGEVKEISLNELKQEKIEYIQDELTEKVIRVRKDLVEKRREMAKLDKWFEDMYEYYAKEGFTKEEINKMFNIKGIEKEVEKPRREFSNIYEHYDYLNNKGLYKVEKNKDIYIVSGGDLKMKSTKTIYPLDGLIDSQYHGTSVWAAKEILKNGNIERINKNIDDEKYNKIFLSPDINYCKTYGIIGGMDHTKINYISDDKNFKQGDYIIFKINLNNYQVYNYITSQEYVIWGKISSNDIENIYLCNDGEIIRELSKEELINL